MSITRELLVDLSIAIPEILFVVYDDALPRLKNLYEFTGIADIYLYKNMFGNISPSSLWRMFTYMGVAVPKWFNEKYEVEKMFVIQNTDNKYRIVFENF